MNDTAAPATVLMAIEPNRGYAPDQIEHPMTLGELAAELEEAIAEWGENARIVTIDLGNRYGANFGRLASMQLFTDADPDDDDDDPYA